MQHENRRDARFWRQGAQGQIQGHGACSNVGDGMDCEIIFERDSLSASDLVDTCQYNYISRDDPNCFGTQGTNANFTTVYVQFPFQCPPFANNNPKAGAMSCCTTETVCVFCHLSDTNGPNCFAPSLHTVGLTVTVCLCHITPEKTSPVQLRRHDI